MTFNQLIILLIVAIVAYFLFKLSLVILIIAIIIIVIYYVINSVNNEVNSNVSYDNMGAQHFKQVSETSKSPSSKSSKSPKSYIRSVSPNPDNSKYWYPPVHTYYQNSPSFAPNTSGLPDKSSAACVHKYMCESGDIKSALKHCKSPMPGIFSPNSNSKSNSKSKTDPEGISTEASYVSAFSDDIFDDSNTDAFDKLCSK